MDNGIAELLDGFCQEHEYEFRPAYSGRGMYDATCPGIVADKNGFDLALELAEYPARAAQYGKVRRCR